jgi:HEAT repeat protein
MAAVVAWLPSGCRREPSRSLARLTVAETDAGRQLASRGIPRAEVARAVAAALEAGARLRAGDEADESARFSARVAIRGADAVTLQAGAPVARVLVTVELAPADGGPPLRESGLGVEPLAGPGAADAALRDALAKAAAAAARSIALQLDASAKSDRELLRDLEAADPDLRDHAVRVLAERKNPAALPGLVERLRDPDPEVADRAVGALAELGDPRAVAPLIEYAHRRGGPAVAGIARLVGDLGGPDARAWLETLAAGHPDGGAREAARDALGALHRRGAAGDSPGPR